MQNGNQAVNMTFTLDRDIESWVKRKTLSEDMNQSQVVRKILRTVMADEAKAKLVKAPKKGEK